MRRYSLNASLVHGDESPHAVPAGGQQQHQHHSLHEPLNFFEDFSYLLLVFLSQQQQQQQQQQHEQPCPDQPSAALTPATSASYLSDTSLHQSSIIIHTNDNNKNNSNNNNSNTMNSSSSNAVGQPRDLAALWTLLQRAQRSVEAGGGASSAAAQSPQYLTALKRLLEEQVHSHQARALGFTTHAPNPSPSASSLGVCTPAPPAKPAAASAGSVEWEGRPSHLRHRGRRYSLPDTSTTPPLAPGGPSERGAAAKVSTEERATSPPTPLVHHNGVSQNREGGSASGSSNTAAAAAACHGRLLALLQQHLVWALRQLERAVAGGAAQSGGLRGILTAEMCAQLQSRFLLELLRVVDSAATATDAGSDEVLALASVLRTAIMAHSAHHSATATAAAASCGRVSAGLVVHEVGGGHDMTPAPAPSAVDLDGEEGWPGAAGDGGPVGGYGVPRAGFPPRLVAQHIWCYERILQQRFPSHRGPWAALEAARAALDPQRSPTPVAPSRSLTASPPPAEGRLPPSASPSTRSSVVSDVSTSPSPAVRRRSAASLDLPRSRGPSAAGTECVRRSPSSAFSAGSNGSGTPTRPPPFVDRTGEKGSRPPLSPEDGSVAEAGVVVSRGPSSSSRARDDNDGSCGNSGDAVALRLVDRLEPCGLFDVFLQTRVGRGGGCRAFGGGATPTESGRSRTRAASILGLNRVMKSPHPLRDAGEEAHLVGKAAPIHDSDDYSIVEALCGGGNGLLHN